MTTGPVVAIVAPGGNLGKVFVPEFVKAVEDGRFGGLKIITSDTTKFSGLEGKTNVVAVQVQYNDEAGVTAALEGADVVVSTMGNVPDSPLILAKAAGAAKSVKILITSDYGLDYDAYYSDVFAGKIAIVKAGRDLGLTVVPISIGAFMEWFRSPVFGIDGDNWDIKRKGDIPVAITHTLDITNYTIRVIQVGHEDPKSLPPRVRVFSESRTMNEYADLVESVTGKKVVRTYTPEEKITENIKAKGMLYGIQAGLGAPCSDFTKDNHNEFLNPGHKYFVPHSFEAFLRTQPE